MKKEIGIMKDIFCRQIKWNLHSNRLLLFVLFIFPAYNFALNNNNQCDRFHVGTFIYESKVGKIIIIRKEKEEIDYREYPNHYIRQSVKWISSCTAEIKTLEMNDPILSPESINRSLNATSYLHILETYPDGYLYKTTNRKGESDSYGKVQLYKGSL
ncbi:hypothetical protein EHQ92_06720 [Leptospira biflexa]|uniref:hypothetical protein n=1 Tax=Leptospira biflexa TaxID=172 RepID=UPI00109181D1|nr:hypothetical protein [Leptospira biflexa]TGM47599.1 hypothetical protein EHQ92_06720 [Leptospira biflexa]TGM49935.1 hypothetical protein EHQ88_06365 [Leptospira biflexa]